MEFSLPLSKGWSTFFWLSLLSLRATALNEHVKWDNCGPSLYCATIDVPFEYGATNDQDDKPETAKIQIVRFNATVPAEQRLGSILVNPGGPGASGVSFVFAGAGAAISSLTDGFYDIIGFDPRGTGLSSPHMDCFKNAGEEYDFASKFPLAPDLWLGEYGNSSYDEEVKKAITSYDSHMKELADACNNVGGETLLISSAAYVARDMAMIVDALDGDKGLLNYWGFSYGTVYLTEFIQAFPERVGRVIADGVVNPEANARSYDTLLPTDQVSVPDAIADFVNECQRGGPENCALAKPASKTLGDRLNLLFEKIFKYPITVDDEKIGSGVLGATMLSMLRLPAVWQTLAKALASLEDGDGDDFQDILKQTAPSEPRNRTGSNQGLLSSYAFQCIDNAATSEISIDDMVKLTETISLQTQTPFLHADLGYISFCRHYPNDSPVIPNAGVKLMNATNKVLTQANKTVLIINPAHDPVTPLVSAEKLRHMLSTSSVLVTRGGSGHTSVSLASLAMANVISRFFVLGVVPADDATFAPDQDLFPADVKDQHMVTPPRFRGTHSKAELDLLHATYAIAMSFLALV